MSSREQFEIWGCSDRDLSITLKCETYAGIAWLAWQAATSAMEAKCAALAADNDTAMAALKQADEVVKSAYEKYVALADENMALKSARQNAMTLPETPDTDSFLAEVRAQGVEMLAENHQNVVDALNGDSLFADGERRHAAIAAAAVYFAAQLRKGAAQ